MLYSMLYVIFRYIAAIRYEVVKFIVEVCSIYVPCDVQG